MVSVVPSIQHITDVVSMYGFISQSLTGIKGLSEAKVDKICEAAEKLLVYSVILFCIDAGSETSAPSVVCDEVF